MVDRILELPEGTRLQILAPVVRGRKGSIRNFLGYSADGFVQVRVDGELHEVTDSIDLDKNKKHIEIVVDRIILRSGVENRLADPLGSPWTGRKVPSS